MSKYWTKPRIVFITWAAVELVGWVVTHFFQDPRVNWVWLALTIAGMIPMFIYMPWKVEKLRKILLLWLIALIIGMTVSYLAFLVVPLMGLAAYLGVFWLILMGVAFLVNAVWWTPRLFIIGGILQIVAGVIPLVFPGTLYYQYLIAAVAGTGAMLILLPNK